MSRKGPDPISSLNRGTTDWKIKVKVIRKWRGATNGGEIFKAFNVILIDQQGSKIHAFIPGKHATQHEDNLREGNICFVKNFTVQKYKEDERFRPVHHENQLILSGETIIREVDEKVNNFPPDAFDFYDHSELSALADKTPYLIDVVGIIENPESVTLRSLMTRQQRNQFQTKFRITDGSSSIPITFWDSMAERFHKQLLIQDEDPIIVILTCCRCGTWNKELDMSNVAATNFYFNYNHHSVKQIRKIVATPEFTQKKLGKQKRKTTEVHNVEAIQNLGNEYIEASIILHANIRYVDEGEPWILFICTECKNKVACEREMFRCNICKRKIPHPEKRFQIYVIASDNTGPLEIKLEDRQVRILIGKRAEDLWNEHKQAEKYPPALKNLVKTSITVKLKIKEGNVKKEDKIYLATDICTGIYIPPEQNTQVSESTSEATFQASTSTYHLDGLSELKFQ